MSSWGDNFAGGGEGGDGEADAEGDDFQAQDDHVLFLVDARPPMFQQNTNGEAHIVNCLRICLDVMKSKIVGNDKSCIGLTLFGAARAAGVDEGSTTSALLTVVLPLETPTAAKIKFIESLVADPSGFGLSKCVDVPDAAALATTSAPCPLKEALWGCAEAFHNVGSRSRGAGGGRASRDSRRLWLFTNHDDMHGIDAKEQAKVVQVARDCAETGIELSLWHMSRRDSCGEEVLFNPLQFYVQLLLSKKDYDKFAKLESASASQRASDSQLVLTQWSQTQHATNMSALDDEDDGGAVESLQDRIQGCGLGGFDSKMYRVRRKEHKKRRLGTLTLRLARAAATPSDSEEITGDFCVAMAMYKLVQPASRPQYVWLHSLTNQPTKSVSVKMDTNSAAVLDASQIHTSVEFAGGQQTHLIPMTAAQMRLLKSGAVPARRAPAADGALSDDSSPALAGLDGEEGAAEEALDPSSGLATPYIDLLYFIDASALHEDMQFKESLFLFPDENTITGSTSAFRSLLKQMSTKGVVGVGRMLRGVSEQRLVALLPRAETIDTDGYLEKAGGLEVIHLPFTQEVRTGAIASAEFASNDADVRSLHSAAEDLVKSLTFGPSFRYSDLESPGLQYFYATLQAIALAEDHCDWEASRDDMLLPDKDSFAAHEDRLVAFVGAAGLPSCSDGSDVVKSTQSRKRALASSSEGAPPAKATKSAAAADEDAEGEMSLEEIKEAANADKLMRLTLAALKHACRVLGLPVTGAKAVLCERIHAKVAS